jgi:hypothetical protein
MYTFVVLFHVVSLALVAAAVADLFPAKLYDSLLRGLHNTIGITTPTQRQLRWVLIVWVLSAVVIFDAMALLLVYVF